MTRLMVLCMAAHADYQFAQRVALNLEGPVINVSELKKKNLTSDNFSFFI